MRAIFVMIKCEMGQAYKVAREAADTIEQMSELYSTSGQYDLPTGGCTNVTITFMGLTLRTADHIAKTI